MVQLLQQWVGEKVKDDKLDEIPTPREMLGLVHREPLLEETEEESATDKERMASLFAICVDELLPKVCGSKRWSVGVRCEGHVSTHAPPESGGKPHVHAGDEAFLVVAWENNHMKWIFCQQRKKEGPSLDPEGMTDEEKEKLVTPHTNASGGQMKCGGCVKIGRDRFNEVEDLIKKAKKQKHVGALEEAAMLAVQERDNWAEVICERNAKKPSKKAAVEDADDEDDSGNEFELED